ncbi:hypothetical protein AOLI_G00083630 [Acnodon oligacanthus]
MRAVCTLSTASSGGLPRRHLGVSWRRAGLMSLPLGAARLERCLNPVSCSLEPPGSPPLAAGAEQRAQVDDAGDERTVQKETTGLSLVPLYCSSAASHQDRTAPTNHSLVSR